MTRPSSTPCSRASANRSNTQACSRPWSTWPPARISAAEPVEGNEILNVIQRRLLAEAPDEGAATAAADAYGQVFTQMRRAYADGEPGRQQAEEEGLALRERIKASYPFHPALIDLMRERWAAIPDFPAHPRRLALSRLLPTGRPPRGGLAAPARPR